MNTPELTGHHKKTYQQLFQHPMSGNLDWQDVLSMLAAVPGVAVEDSGGGSHVKVSRGEQTLTLHRPRGKDFSDKAQLTHLKHFLEGPTPADPATAVAAAGTHLLVVIDHHTARVFSAEMRGAEAHRIEPYDPHGFRHELHHDEEAGSGKRDAEEPSYYRAVARTLTGAEQVLLFGTGTGESNAAEHLLAVLKKDYPDVAGRVVATVKVDEKHLSDDQLLAKARTHFKGQ